jgi:hypothetical protein
MKITGLALVLILMFAYPLLAQQVQISGTVKDTLGEPVSFASIYIKGTTKGTSANIDGVYVLKVNPGLVTLVFKAIGFKPSEKTINTTESTQADLIMTAESYTLKGVTISANSEDPAYAIMRQAISKRRRHLVEVKEFSCSVYIKGLQKLMAATYRRRWIWIPIEKGSCTSPSLSLPTTIIGRTRFTKSWFPLKLLAATMHSASIKPLI